MFKKNKNAPKRVRFTFLYYTCIMAGKINPFNGMNSEDLMTHMYDAGVNDYARMSGWSVNDFLNMVKGTGIIPIDTSKPVGMKGHSGPTGPKGESGEPGLLMSALDFGMKLQELGMYGELSKKRYFELKKLYTQ